MNVKGFFSVGSEDVVTGGVLGGLPKVKPTGLPRLPPEVPGVVVAEDAPKVNFDPVGGNPPNGERVGVGLSLSELAPPKIFVVEEDAEAPNPPNEWAGLSALVFPNPPKTLVVAGFSEVPDPKGEGVAVLSFSLSSLSPNTEVVDGPANGLLVEVEGPPKRNPEDVEVEAKNEVDLGLSFGGSSAGFLAREDAKKFGMVEGGLLSEPVVPPKPNVGAGGPPEDSEVGVGVERNVNPVDGFELSVVVVGVKPLGFKPNEGVPEVLGGAGVGSLGVGVVVDEGALDKLGALNRTDGPGSGPSGSVFLGEFLNEPVSCLSHTDWMARRLAVY